ncbi:MAG: FliI/YscN family ATPase [Methylacidiphilaceae bacterium]|nr:FliI/YscN family ATPase [Candidatus Methylacidiphilaceae bacterium]
MDGLGRRIDSLGGIPLVPEVEVPIQASPPNPMERRRIASPIPLGVRVIDGLLTCGEGQRVGIFAAAGVGKSSLLAQILRNARADVVVLALIGERGREVREFLEEEIGEESRERAVLVVSTSDRPAMERVRAAYVATAVAEYFRDRGERVLFMMDSVTRFARALREIGLAAGEPPTRRGYPPSVFAALPKLLERCGQSSRGSITAIYTILVEGDDPSEPVADEMRSLLDGHILLSRKLAASSHYPAVDVLGSVSRVFSAIATGEHQAAAARLRMLLAKYQEVELLARVGEYQSGSDPLADEALAKLEAIQGFLRQRPEEEAPFEETLAALRRIVE